jgi:hypothetical protein
VGVTSSPGGGVRSADPTLSDGVTTTRARRGFDVSSVIVWGVLAVMAGVVLRNIAKYGRNIPLAEDWTMVPALTGHQSDFWSWLWSQNNEHRLPLPRLVYLGLLRVTHDFRVGMVFNVIVLGLVAAVLILAARRVRGRTSVVDAFFPVALLHLGNWENMVWGWQMQFVISTALVLVILAVLVAGRAPLSPATILLAAAPLLLLPLVGGSGLPMVPAAIGGLGVLILTREAQPGRRIFIASAVASLVILAVYFVGWERPSWYPDNPGPKPTAKTTGKLLAMGWGPAVSRSWTLAALGTLLVLASAVVVLVLAMRRPGPERRRAIALGCFFGGCMVVTVAVGYGRAALVRTQGLPDRYALLGVPALFAAWFAWELFGPARLCRVVQGAMLAAALLLLPANVHDGHEWRDYYTSGMRSVERDIRAGATTDEIVARHREFLMHWSSEQLRRNIELLREDDVGPFADVPDD